MNGQMDKIMNSKLRVYPDRTKVWWKNGKRYRENGLPAVECSDGTKVWFNKSGVRYRYDEWIRFSWQLVPF